MLIFGMYIINVLLTLILILFMCVLLYLKKGPLGGGSMIFTSSIGDACCQFYMLYIHTYIHTVYTYIYVVDPMLVFCVYGKGCMGSLTGTR